MILAHEPNISLFNKDFKKQRIIINKNLLCENSTRIQNVYEKKEDSVNNERLAVQSEGGRCLYFGNMVHNAFQAGDVDAKLIAKMANIVPPLNTWLHFIRHPEVGVRLRYDTPVALSDAKIMAHFLGASEEYHAALRDYGQTKEWV